MNKKLNTKLVLRTIKDLTKVLVLMLDEVAVIVVILLVLHFLGIQITLPIKICAGIILIIFVLLRHVLVIPSFHRKQATGREGMIGEQGKVVEPLSPLGVITVRGEYWNAKSAESTIETGKNVEIVGLEGLTLIVERKDDKTR
jgi:membrane-bound ClpP family serine protease